MNKYFNLNLYLIVLSLFFSGCTQKDRADNVSENDTVFKAFSYKIIDYDKLWTELVKESTDLQGKVYYGDKLEILALKRCYETTNPKFNWKYQWEVFIYYRNVSKKKIKVPLSTGKVVNRQYYLPEVKEYSDGSKLSSWSIYSKKYLNYRLKGSTQEYEFVELLPGEVAVSRRLDYSFYDFESLKRLNENVYLEIKCDTLYEDHWHGVARVGLPIFSKTTIKEAAPL